MATLSQLDQAQRELSRALEVKENIDSMLTNAKQHHQNLSDTIQAHLAKLTEIELEFANFIEHSFGIYKGVTIDPADNSNYKFDENGHVEAAIAISQDSWNDGSHLSLHRKV